MLKHLPEGLVPFEDCGFARHPLHPLAGETVTVDCRVDAGDPAPRLQLHTGADSWEVAARRKDERHFAFCLGSFPFGEEVRYTLKSGGEEAAFTFRVQRRRTATAALRLLRDGDRLHLCFEGFSVTFTREKQGLTAEAHRRPVSGQRCETVDWPLDGEFSLQAGGPDFIWILKRLSKPVAGVTRYTVTETAEGEITSIRQEGPLEALHVWGAGERFDSADLRRGGSNGRVVEKFTRQGDQTYLPVPFFMTEGGLGWRRDSSIPAAMDFTRGLTICQQVRGESLTRDCLYFGKPGEVLSRFIAATGEPVLPPDWAFGLWISANGWNCDEEVDSQLEALRRFRYPADVMVLEAWSDENTFYRWNDGGQWADPADTVRRIRQAGLHLVLWQIPIIKHEWNGEPNEHLLADIAEVERKGYCVKNADGTPYRITENWFHHSLLMDFTNPEAVEWWFGKRKYLLDMGVEGFKTDGGEFLFPEDARLHNGMTGLEAHNLYPGQYIGAYHDFMRKNGVRGVTFSRADYAGAQTRPMHWAGDQQSLWTELEAQLQAGLSAGLSGVLFWGFDIGGFAGELPTAELYLRATALGCFSPVMQWHAEPRTGQFYATHEDGFNNDRSPWNLAEKLGDDRLLTVATDFAWLRRKLLPYLTREAAHCARACRPMMAHLCIDFPDDPAACACTDEYMLGRNLLVAPIVREGETGRRVYLPHGEWRDYFTGETLRGGCFIQAECPLERIPVYERSEADG